MTWAASTGTKTLVLPATCTMTIASPCVVTLSGHGLSANDMVVFTTTGALPTGITAGQVYYVISAGLTSSAFEFSATEGGSAVNTSGSQSGTHTLTSEFVLSEVSTIATYVLLLDLVNMALGDLIEARLYDKIDTTNYRQILRGSWQHPQINAGVIAFPFPVTTGARFTLKQLTGTARSVPWSVRSI